MIYGIAPNKYSNILFLGENLNDALGHFYAETYPKNRYTRRQNINDYLKNYIDKELTIGDILNYDMFIKLTEDQPKVVLDILTQLANKD